MVSPEMMTPEQQYQDALEQSADRLSKRVLELAREKGNTHKLLRELVDSFDRDHHLPCGWECSTCDRFLEIMCQIEELVQKPNGS